jgi:ribonuclease HII
MRWIIGIDEVGRGSLAGPVVVAAAALPKGFVPRNRALGALRDSKKLSARQREGWLSCFGNPDNRARVAFAVSRVYPREIERRNISKAANIAAKRAFSRLVNRWGKKGARAAPAIFLDGGLFLGNGGQPKNAKTIIKGDEKIGAVKVASIVAKVHRDRFMVRLAKKYPGYGFDVHKGYGTKMHRRAIGRRGPCPAHRLTFIGKSVIMEP